MDGPVIVMPGSDRSAERLDQWLARHGPLAVPDALLLTLALCEQASRMTRSQRRAARQSLHSSNIVRTPEDGWRWQLEIEQSAGSRMADAELVESMGRVLYHALVGEPLGDLPVTDRSLSERLRRARRSVPADVVDLTTRAIIPGPGQRNLSSFARELSLALGAGKHAIARRARQVAVLMVGVVMLVTAAWLELADATSPIRAHGFTDEETVWSDIVREAAQTFAITDEHTAAIQQYQALARQGRERLPPDDPRLAWHETHEAWVRTLSGDRLTAEQLLENTPGWLSAQLGDSHPYVRTARLALADGFAARGAGSEADALRLKAAQATRALFGSDDHRVWQGVPGAPGVVAHVAPNAPEREGFRPVAGDGFFAPLTTAQRMLMEHRGWQIHVVASGRCQIAVDVGITPRRLALDTVHNGDGTWNVRIDGATAAQPLTASAADDLLVSIVGGSAGRFDVKVGHGAVVPLKAKHTAPVLPPPYGVTFRDDRSSRGCKVVWMEIQFPSAPIRGPVEPPIAPVAAPSVLLVQHRGRVDPTLEGFRDRGGLDRSGPVVDEEGQEAWLTAGSGCCSYYHHDLDVRRAFSGEWRLMADLRLAEGPGYAEVGINPDSSQPRFDVSVQADGVDAVVSLGGSPFTHRVPQGMNRWVQVELRYDPGSRAVSLFVNGTLQFTGYTGWMFARENRGVLFGAYDAVAHYRFVHFETGPPRSAP